MKTFYSTFVSVRNALSRILTDPNEWWQLIALLGVLLIAWFSSWQFQRWRTNRGGRDESLAATTVQKVLAPIVVAIASWLSSVIIEAFGAPNQMLRIAATLALSFAAVRLLVFALQRMLRPGPLLATSEKLIAWSIWAFVAIYLLGWNTPIVRALESVSLPFGTKHFTLLDAFRAIATLVISLLVAGYLGIVVERRVMAAIHVSIGVRVGVVKFTKLALVLVAAMVAIDNSGINLTALQVFGGALGVGLGFGLQRVASNFVCGFILVGDRSIRQGDVITIGDRFGVVTELRARYVVVRDRDNVDTLIPNETMITSEVVNWSYGDRNVRLKLPVQISYDDNPRQALDLLVRAGQEHPRVLKDPAPAARVRDFGDNGIDLELRFWIRDPEDGVNNVRSDLYLAIWDCFKAAGITIPYPQRDLHLRSGWPTSTST